MKILLIIICLFCSLNLKAQTQEEIAAAQKEYMQQMSKLMNCDTLARVLKLQYQSLDSNALSKEQLLQIKQSINEQIKTCKEYGAMFGGGTNQPNISVPNTTTNSIEKVNLPGAKESTIGVLEMPNAYKISYLIKEGQDVVKMDMFLSDNTANYGIITKDPETGDNFYSAYKEATKTMYMVGKGFVMTYDFGEFQKSGQSLTPSSEEISNYALKPTGATKTIAGYLCKELTGKTDDGSILKIWVAYGIKSGSNVVPGARYLASEKALSQKLYGTSELGFFLEVTTTNSDGATTITATSVSLNPPKILIDTKGYQMMDGNQMMNMINPRNK